MRARAVGAALLYGILPWRMYECTRHYSCSYAEHLLMNLQIAWRWATWRERPSDVEFHGEAGNDRLVRPRHRYGPHPALELPCVRQCAACLRVEERCFMAAAWRYVPHLSGLDEVHTRALLWRRRLARELNEQMIRRNDPRAVW